MASLVNPYRAKAQAFQSAKVAGGETAIGKLYSQTRGELKKYSFSQDYKSFITFYIRDASAQQKALKKFEEWHRKEPPKANEERIFNPFHFQCTLSAFGPVYMGTLNDKLVMDARFLKKSFKLETFKRFEKGTTVEQLQGQLEGLSEKTIKKVAYWMNTYQALKQSGKLDAKIEEMTMKINDYA